jgi:glyoxylate/hydroxypyruvate reductase A
MALILHLRTAREQWWQSHLQTLLPDIECRLWREPGNPDDIEYAVVWRPPEGGLKQFRHLKCIVSVGAGVDHVLADSQLPPNVPIIRTTGSDLTQRMREYVCLHVLRLHRNLDQQMAAQRESRWQPDITPTASMRRVGVMGLGKLGSDAARALQQLGFDVAGYARSPRQLDGIDCYHGEDQLADFLSSVQILVCLLPLTAATDSLMNRDFFALLPKGASIINTGRGEHLVEHDLLAALDSGHLASATLDVFREEPLPAAHPFWTHPKILVTPHVGSMIDPETGGHEIARNLRDFIKGAPVADLIDRAQGY